MAHTPALTVAPALTITAAHTLRSAEPARFCQPVGWAFDATHRAAQPVAVPDSPDPHQLAITHRLAIAHHGAHITTAGLPAAGQPA